MEFINAKIEDEIYGKYGLEFEDIVANFQQKSRR